MVYYSAQLKASTAFVILHFMVSDCSSIPLHTNRRASKNSSTSTVRLSSMSPKLNEDAPAMVISHGSESEAKPIFHGNQTKNNVNALKNAQIFVTININENVTEDDSYDSIHTIRSKRSTQCSILKPSLSISSETQKWVNYLANYKVSCNECHSYCSVNNTEIGRSLKIGNLHWSEWNVISACPLNISVEGSLVTAKCADTNNTHACGHVYQCRQVHYRNRDISKRWYTHPVGCVNASWKSYLGRKMTEPPSYY